MGIGTTWFKVYRKMWRRYWWGKEEEEWGVWRRGDSHCVWWKMELIIWSFFEIPQYYIITNQRVTRFQQLESYLFCPHSGRTWTSFESTFSLLLERSLYPCFFFGLFKFKKSTKRGTHNSGMGLRTHQNGDFRCFAKAHIEQNSYLNRTRLK